MADVRFVPLADPPSAVNPYAGVVRNAVQSLWAEPRAPEPPKRVWRDWALVAALVPTAVLEGILRPDLVWRPVALIVGVALVFTLLSRRTSPLAAVAVAFGASTLLSVAMYIGADMVTGLYTMAYLLVLPYSLCRWGAGREVALGLAIMLVAFLVSLFTDFTGIGDALGGFVILMFPAALGISVRYQATSLLRKKDQVKMREREQLARELHDTVAHHISAIAIRAQAGRTVAASEPKAALDALEVIEEAASRTLAEMRSMVGVLRQDDAPDLAPQRGVADIARLAHGAGDRLLVDVELSGDLDRLRPSVEAAIYRIAQESITNALLHARHATRIDVRVFGDQERVRLTVSDDGTTGPFDAGSSSGYGLLGMTERATLLGGRLEVGPSPGKGWTVDAMLPRSGTGA